MKTPLDRVRKGGIILATVFVVAVAGYCLLGDYSLLDAIWMVVITISSVGYAEKSSMDPALMMFTIAVIVVGMAAAAYTLGALLQMLVEGELKTVLGQRRMLREIEELDGHVVICGFGRVGQILAKELHDHERRFVVIDQDSAAHEEARELGFLALLGDAAEDVVLLRAGVKRAASIVSGLPNDATNVFITLTARSLNEDIQIIARADHLSTEGKLIQAGADRIVMPSLIGAELITRLITKPSTAELIGFVNQRTFQDLDLDEITIPAACELVGMSIRETDASRRFRLLIVAIKSEDSEMAFNPQAGHVLKGNDVMLITGHVDAIARFRAEYGLG